MLLPFRFFPLWLALLVSFSLRIHASEPTWRYVEEMSPHERKIIDLIPQSQRGPRRSRLPIEQFPFSPPYFAEEIGLRAMEFPHTPLWNCLLIDIGVTVTADGLLDQQVGLVICSEMESGHSLAPLALRVS